MAGWTPEEDHALCCAWVVAMEPAARQRRRTVNDFWQAVSAWIGREFAVMRSPRGAMQRWELILPRLKHFTACYHHVGGSKASHAVDKSLRMYKHTMGCAFDHLLCWEVLRNSLSFTAECDEYAKTNEFKASLSKKKFESSCKALKAKRGNAKTAAGDYESLRTPASSSTKKRASTESDDDVVTQKRKRRDDGHTHDEDAGDSDDMTLSQCVAQLARAAEEHNALLEMQLGMGLFTRPLPDAADAHEYLQLARLFVLEKQRQRVKKQDKEQRDVRAQR